MTLPAGERVLDVLPALTRALDGTGPALLPLGEADPRRAQIARHLAAGAPLDPGEDDPGDPTALVMATSGSTGAPKGVLLSAGQLAASAAATEQRLGGPGHWLLALPAYHIAGMQVLLRAARSGGEPLVLRGDKPFAARDFVTLAEQLPGPRRYVSLVPTQLRRIVDDAEAAAATAEMFDAILVGGAVTPPGLLTAARTARLPVVTTYGMSETCGGCVYDGTPLTGVTATLSEAGAIVLAGPMVARGYRGRPGDPAFPASARTSGGTNDTPRSFVTSDAGEIGRDGTLLVLGRLDDVIISGGEKVSPAPVEAAIRALPGIRDVLVVGVPDAEWGQAVAALVVPEPGASARTVAELRAALSSTGVIPHTHLPHRLLVVDAIPLLPSGKPDRQAARARWTP
jgi:O-succinylbenzoic acid--CoA ligase